MTKLLTVKTQVGQELAKVGFLSEAGGRTYTRQQVPTGRWAERGGPQFLQKSRQGWQAFSRGWSQTDYYPDPLTALAHAELMHWGRD